LSRRGKNRAFWWRHALGLGGGVDDPIERNPKNQRSVEEGGGEILRGKAAFNRVNKGERGGDLYRFRKKLVRGRGVRGSLFPGRYGEKNMEDSSAFRD